MMDVGPLEIVLYDKSVYIFPYTAKIVGWILAVSSVLMVPIIAIKTISSYPGDLGQVRYFFHKFSKKVHIIEANLPQKLGHKRTIIPTPHP